MEGESRVVGFVGRKETGNPRGASCSKGLSSRARVEKNQAERTRKRNPGRERLGIAYSNKVYVGREVEKTPRIGRGRGGNPQ